MGCQESVEDVSSGEGNILADSPLAILMSNTTSFDGSFDNAIDNSSCISVQLPVDVTVNGQSLTVNDESEIGQVEAILNEEMFDFDNIEIEFPIAITNSDYSEQIINSQEELDAIRATCIEGGLDTDIECVDFNYPISFQVYDSENQRASTTSLNSDREVYEYMNTIPATNIVALDFPISLTLSDGSIESFNNNETLSLAIENSNNSCDELDIQFYNNSVVVPFQTGRLTVKLTDAPFPLDLVAETNVVIDNVMIKLADEEDSLLTITVEEFDINLIELTNGITVELADIEVPEGTYDQIRLSVSESTVMLTDGTIYNLKIPSENIKVEVTPNIAIDADEPVELLLDFDVSRSFVVQGNPDTPAGIKGFIFEPVIKAVNLAETGTLNGMVENTSAEALEGAQLSVFAADTLNTTAFTDVNGAYTILGLLPGDYEVVAEIKGHVSDTLSASILLQDITVVNFQLVEE